MQKVFLRIVLLMVFCALVFAPREKSTKGPKKDNSSQLSPAEVSQQPAIYKVEVLDHIGRSLFKIISFNKPMVPVDELWNSIYQIPFIAEYRSNPIYSKYLHLTIITPGQPHVKIANLGNEMLAGPNASVDVGNSVVLLSFSTPQHNIMCVTTDESVYGNKLVAGSKSILLDFVVTAETTDYPANIWKNAPGTIWFELHGSSASWHAWHDVNRIRVKAYDRNGKGTTDVELLKNSTPGQEKLNIENGVIYIDLNTGPTYESESGVTRIVPLWINEGSNLNDNMGVFRFTKYTSKRTIWQKMKNKISDSSYYREWSLIEVRIEMIGMENLVITANDEKYKTNTANFENAIAVIYTVRRAEGTIDGKTKRHKFGAQVEKLKKLFHNTAQPEGSS